MISCLYFPLRSAHAHTYDLLCFSPLETCWCAGLAELRTLSCASCTGFRPDAVQALASMKGLIELNLRGVMPSPGPATLRTLTALQALTGMLLFPSTLCFRCDRDTARLM